MPLPVPPREPTLALESAAARHVVAQVARVAPTSMSVLFTGETGTGKEVMARLTHAWSPRHAKPFVPINCAAIPNELMEAELFGYARGAFSGAVQRYDGQLMAAEGGTVLLDEIDDTPLETQVEAAARARRSRGQPPRRERLARGGLPAARGDQPRSRAAHRSRPLRRGSLRAARDRHDAPRAAARAARGSARSGGAFRAALRPRARPRGGRRDSRRRAACARGVSVAGQHPRAAQRDLRDARLQARRAAWSCRPICPGASSPAARGEARSRRSIDRPSRARSRAAR